MTHSDPREDERDGAKKAVLDLFATATNIPITLYEFPYGVHGTPKVILSDESKRHFAKHCRVISQYDSGVACREDQIARARAVFRTGKTALVCCHAGLFNEAVPILNTENQPRAVVSYGEVRLRGKDNQQVAAARHEQVVGRLRLPMLEAQSLEDLRLQAPELDQEEFEGFSGALHNTIRLLYTLIDQDEQMQRKTDQLSHEMQTPIQDVLAKTDNVLNLWPALGMDEAQLQKAGLPHTTLTDLYNRVRQAWYASHRLRTVAQTLTLGSYMADYRFAECSLLPLLYDARANYMAEAQSRHIDIEIRLRQDVGDPPTIECSREHLQLALNNLMHNAVKYSYKGGEWRRRYVRVTGQFVGDRFELVFANYGIGILPDEIQSGKIFEDGYQGVLRQGEFRTGSGKGLVFVKSVVERHQGEIEIKSDPRAEDDAGPDDKLPYLTRVTLFLPRRQPPS